MTKFTSRRTGVSLYAMKKFCRETGRTYESNRVQVVAYKDKNGRVVRFGRSTSQKAVHASKKD